MSAGYALWGLDGRAPAHIGTLPALTIARGCWGALSAAVIVAHDRVVDVRGEVDRTQLAAVLRAERARLEAVAAAVIATGGEAAPVDPPAELPPAPPSDVPGRPETSPDVPAPVALETPVAAVDEAAEIAPVLAAAEADSAPIAAVDEVIAAVVGLRVAADVAADPVAADVEAEGGGWPYGA